MPALRRLPMSHYEAQAVLLPSRDGKELPEGIRITVYGEYFPIRAVEPELLAGDTVAEYVRVARDQRSISGCFTKRPPEGALIRVRYGDSQEGELEQRFSSQAVRPLPRECK